MSTEYTRPSKVSNENKLNIPIIPMTDVGKISQEPNLPFKISKTKHRIGSKERKRNKEKNKWIPMLNKLKGSFKNKKENSSKISRSRISDKFKFRRFIVKFPTPFLDLLKNDQPQLKQKSAENIDISNISIQSSAQNAIENNFISPETKIDPEFHIFKNGNVIYRGRERDPKRLEWYADPETYCREAQEIIFYIGVFSHRKQRVIKTDEIKRGIEIFNSSQKKQNRKVSFVDLSRKNTNTDGVEKSQSIAEDSFIS